MGLRDFFRSLMSRSNIENPRVPITSEAIFDVFGLNKSSSGVAVTHDTAFTIPAFFRGVDLIASTMGRVKSPVYKPSSNEGKEKDTAHPAYNILNKRWNNWMSSFAGKQQLVKDALWSGNGFAVILRDVNGLPTQLIPLDPETTFPIVTRNVETAEVVDIVYHTSIQGILGNPAVELDIPFSDCIHLKGLGQTQGIVGMRLIDYAKECMGLGIAVQKYGATYFANGGNPKLVIELPATIKNKEQLEEYRKGLNQIHGGLSNAHKTLLLVSGSKLAATTTINNEEAQFLESREMTAIDVANVLGLPPHKLGAKVNTSYNSLEQEELALLSDTYDKWFVNLESEFELKLLSEFEKARGTRFIQFDREALLAADTSTKIKNVIEKVNAGLMSLNEGRLELNLDTLADENANKHRMPTNLTFSEDVQAPTDLDGDPQADAGQAPDADNATDAEAPTGDDLEEPGGNDAKVHPQFRALKEQTISRLATRLRKAKNLNPGDHIRVFLDALQPFGERGLTSVTSLFDELAAVLPEQYGEVIDRWESTWKI